MNPHRPSSHALIAVLFVAAAMGLGGGGSPTPGAELALQLLCLAAGLAWLWANETSGRIPAPGARAVWLIAAAAVAVPLLQLVPLPATVWRALPGQADRIAALALVDADYDWRGLSLSPSRTLAGLLAIVPAVLTMLAVASLDYRGRTWVVRTIAAGALASALLGAVQLSIGAATPHLYSVSNTGVTGFQANKNAEADVLLIGLLAVAAAGLPWLLGKPDRPRGHRSANSGQRAAWLALAGAALLLLSATIFTNSRAGIALILVALAALWVIVYPALPRARARWLWLALALGGGAVVVVAGLASGNAALGQVFGRFAVVDDFRRELWHDGWFALQRSWPTGIGLGGAENALAAAERLEVVDQSAPNRVHNDYLEFLLEGGIAAASVLVAGAVLIAAAARRAWRDRPVERPYTAFGMGILAVLALHSFVDYPLRSMALACLAGVATGLLFPHARTSGREAEVPEQRVVGSSP